MKGQRTLVMLTLLPLALAACSNRSPEVSSAPNTNSGFQDRLAQVITRSSNAVPQHADDINVVLPGRHMSEHQVAELVSSQLPRSSGFDYRCEFKDGTWDILEVQPKVWGVASQTTNADGKIMIHSTNATRVVLRVRDADGKVEPIK
jgi:hypothetical protein